MKPAIFPLLMLFALSTFLVSCDDRKVFDEYHTLTDAEWPADSVQTYSFSVMRKTQNHNIWFNIRNDNSYPYSNLWLFVTIESPKGEAVTDTMQLILAEPSGKWLGKGFTGVYDNRLIYRRNVYFPEPGEYNIKLRQGMRDNLLKGITDVGIRVEKVN